MIEIKDLLEKWHGALFSEAARREAIRRAVSEVLGIPLEERAVEIKNNTVYLDLKPLYKNEIFLKQEAILRRLEASSPGKRMPDGFR